MSIPDQSITERTIVLERFRALAMGIYESAASTFLLLILVRWFNGSAGEKSLIAAGNNTGLLFAPLVVFLTRKLQWSAPRGIGTLLMVAALALMSAAFVTHRTAFVVLALVGTLLPAAASPLLTSVFQENYPVTSRGQIFSNNNAIRIATTIIFASGAGWLLSGRLEYYPLLIATFALALAAASWFAFQIPSDHVPAPPSHPLLACFKYLRSDAVLRTTLFSWMLLGLGNLMIIPMRVEFLANPRYQMNLSEMQIALLVSTVPNVARLISSRMWGKIFDRVNFFTLRIVLNITFVLGTVAFFAGSSLPGLLVAAAIIGFSTAGGDVAWNLWVTKIAPPERVSDYMAVHTFFTGVRGFAAPFAAFYLLTMYTPTQVSWFSGALMLLSVLPLVRIRRRHANRYFNMQNQDVANL